MSELGVLRLGKSNPSARIISRWPQDRTPGETGSVETPALKKSSNTGSRQRPLPMAGDTDEDAHGPASCPPVHEAVPGLKGISLGTLLTSHNGALKTQYCKSLTKWTSELLVTGSPSRAGLSLCEGLRADCSALLPTQSTCGLSPLTQGAAPRSQRGSSKAAVPGDPLEQPWSMPVASSSSLG